MYRSVVPSSSGRGAGLRDGGTGRGLRLGAGGVVPPARRPAAASVVSGRRLATRCTRSVRSRSGRETAVFAVGARRGAGRDGVGPEARAVRRSCIARSASLSACRFAAILCRFFRLPVRGCSVGKSIWVMIYYFTPHCFSGSFARVRIASFRPVRSRNGGRETCVKSYIGASILCRGLFFR